MYLVLLVRLLQYFRNESTCSFFSSWTLSLLLVTLKCCIEFVVRIPSLSSLAKSSSCTSCLPTVALTLVLSFAYGSQYELVSPSVLHPPALESSRVPRLLPLQKKTISFVSLVPSQKSVVGCNVDKGRK